MRKLLLAPMFVGLIGSMGPSASVAQPPYQDPPDGSDPCENCLYLARYMFWEMGVDSRIAYGFFKDCNDAWGCG